MITHVIFDWSGTLYDHGAQGLFPGVIPLLKRLKETHTLGLVSRAREGVAQRRESIRALGVEQFFASIVISEQKTEDEVKQCLTELKAKPAETLFVDDRARLGIQAASRAGCQTCWVRQSHMRDEEPEEKEFTPTYIIDNITELARLIAS